MTKKFRYVETVAFSEDQYVAIWKSGKVKKRWRIFVSQLAIAIIIAALSLLSHYTIALGIVLACFFVWLGFIGFLPPPLLRRGYRDLPYLHGPLTFAVTQDGISVTGDHIKANVQWDLFVTWQILGDWLVLTSNGIPKAYFRVDGLKQAKVFDRVMALANSHGKEFGYSISRQMPANKSLKLRSAQLGM